MKPIAMLLGGAAVIGTAALAFAKKTTSSGVPIVAPPSGTPDMTDAAWQQYILTVVGTRDPEQIRAAAKVLRAAGKEQEAQMLEATASAIETANQAASQVQTNWQPTTSSAPNAADTVYSSPGVVQQAAQQAAPVVQTMPPSVQAAVNDAIAHAAGTASQAANAAAGAASVPSPVPAASPLPASDPVVAAAEGITAHLRGKLKGQEDKRRVQAFQTLARLTADGYYGPKTAARIADAGVVPVYPLYWSAATRVADAASYSADMLRRASADPARSAAWTAAATPMGAGAVPPGVALQVPQSPAAPDLSDPQVTYAEAAIAALRGKARGAEGAAAKAAVKKFQQSAGLVADGLYGPKTAEAVAMLGVLPVAPLYWSRVAETAKTQKASWNGLMSGRAAIDTLRAPQWLAAMVV